MGVFKVIVGNWKTDQILTIKLLKQTPVHEISTSADAYAKRSTPTTVAPEKRRKSDFAKMKVRLDVCPFARPQRAEEMEGT